MGCTPLFLNAEPHSTGTNSKLERADADRVPDLVAGERLVGEVLLHQVVVDVRDRLEQLQARGFGLLDHLGRDVDRLELRAFGVVVERPHERLHLDEVDDAAELALGADRQLHDRGVGVEAVAGSSRRNAGSRRRRGPSC